VERRRTATATCLYDSFCHICFFLHSFSLHLFVSQKSLNDEELYRQKYRKLLHFDINILKFWNYWYGAAHQRSGLVWRPPYLPDSFRRPCCEQRDGNAMTDGCNNNRTVQLSSLTYAISGFVFFVDNVETTAWTNIIPSWWLPETVASVIRCLALLLGSIRPRFCDFLVTCVDFSPLLVTELNHYVSSLQCADRHSIRFGLRNSGT